MSERMPRPYPDRVIAAFVFLATAALYIRTTAPTLGGAFDSEEFQHVAYTLGIAHATGYPLYLLLGKIFITLVPIGNVAYRMNLLSALLGAGAAMLVYLNAMLMTRRRIASVATAAIFATNAAVWRQSGVASVNPLHMLILAAIVFALLLWRDQRASLTLVAFLFGLGLAHHRTILFLAPPLALYVWLVSPNILRQPRELLKIFLAVLVPLSLYLYLPIFSSNSPSYSNTIPGFLNQISGGEAGDFLRLNAPQILQGAVGTALYLFDSFGYLGAFLVAIGAIAAMRAPSDETYWNLFLGVTALILCIWGTLYAGEPDRYLALTFVFLIYWFALGVSAVEKMLAERLKQPFFARAARGAFSLTFLVFIALSIPNHFRVADWSSFDRVYKQWDEIFTLPVPQNATIVGNWGQLNAMRYMQFVENRRRDIRIVGTLYDVTPQTNAAREAFEQNRAIFLAPGIAQPNGAYHYALLGPMLEVRDAPQTQPLLEQKNIPISQSLTLSGYSITTALESYIPTQIITPTRTVRVWLDWRADGVVPDFRARIRLYDPEARVLAQIDEPPVRGLYPPPQWTRGEYVRDVHNFLIPGGTPPGKYRITVTAFENEIELGSVTVARIATLTQDQVFMNRLTYSLSPKTIRQIISIRVR